MPGKPQLSIIIPAYNEDAIIGPVLERLMSRYAEEHYEVIVVDDGSTDGTSDIAKATGASVIRHHCNKGYGAAIKTGVRKAKADIVLIMDADGQHNPDDIQNLMSFMDEYDMVVGARQKGSHFTLGRRPWKMLLGAVANYLAERNIPDLNSGFRAIKKQRVLEFMHILPNGFSFSTTITLALLKAGYDVKYTAIRTLEREGRRSSVNFARDGARTIMLIIRTIVLFDPLRVFAPVSVLLFLIGFPFAIYGIVRYRSVPATSVIIVLSSILIFLFGVLADQVSALRRQVSDEETPTEQT
jgi:glycosyltransferase involved in cell wall biosynthesis